MIDGLGRRLVPGLNDSHLHVIRAGRMFALELRWDQVPTLAEGLRLLAERAATTPAGQWVRVIGGWSEFQFRERRMPTLAEINDATGDVPAFVMHLYQGGILNRAAISALGWSRNTRDPVGGHIVRGSSLRRVSWARTARCCSAGRRCTSRSKAVKVTAWRSASCGGGTSTSAAGGVAAGPDCVVV